MTSRFEKNTPIRHKKNQDLLLKQKKTSPRSPKPKSSDEKLKTHALIALPFQVELQINIVFPLPTCLGSTVSVLPSRFTCPTFSDQEHNQNFMMRTILLISSSRGNGWVKTFFFISLVHVKRGKGVSSFPQTDTSDCYVNNLHCTLLPEGTEEREKPNKNNYNPNLSRKKINQQNTSQNKEAKKTNLKMFTTNTKIKINFVQPPPPGVVHLYLMAT